MCIDISNYHKKPAFELLGTGDWQICLPEPYHIIVVSRAWREKIRKMIATHYIRWVLAGKSYEIHHRYDPPWDASGDAEKIEVEPASLLDKYATILDWLENELTGDWEATYESYHGKHWRRYADWFSEEKPQLYSDLYHVSFQHLIETADDVDEFKDSMIEELTDFEICMDVIWENLFANFRTEAAWDTYYAVTLKEIAEEERQAEERARLYHAKHTCAKTFWNAHFADLRYLRIEKPQFKELGLAERLADLLADADPEIVQAIAEIGLFGDFSNSVHEAIKALAREALKVD